MRDRTKMTRPELKKHREALARTTRFLPMLELKQRLLQHTILSTQELLASKEVELANQTAVVDGFRSLLSLPAGLDFEASSRPVRVDYRPVNIAGIHLSILVHVEFPPDTYSRYATEPWVDGIFQELRKYVELRIGRDTLKKNLETLLSEWRKVNQRLNLFEKMVIPRHQHAVHKIRVFLGDEQTAAVGRAKLAAKKLRIAEQRRGNA